MTDIDIFGRNIAQQNLQHNIMQIVHQIYYLCNYCTL